MTKKNMKEVRMGVSSLSASTSHVQNQFHNLQNYNVNLIIMIDVMVVNFEKDIKLFNHDVTITCG